MSAMSSWPARDRKYGKKSEYPGAPRHGGRKTGKFNDLQDKIGKMTQHERVRWHREERRKREEKARAKRGRPAPLIDAQGVNDG
jgi:hypothetical protein